MPKTYDIRFNRDKRAYDPVDITAVVKKVAEGGDIEVDAQIAFHVETPKLLDFQIRKEEKSIIATVSVTQEAQERDDYDELIAKPVEVEVSGKPAEEGENAKLVKEKCDVRISPLPVLAKFIRPAESELPWPALKEQPLEVEVQLFKMKGGSEVPFANASVDIERPRKAKPEAGEFSPETQPPFKTDDQGHLRFTYIPPTAEYRLTGEYVEEFKFVAVSGEKRTELLSWELPLAPSYNYCLTAEKKHEADALLLGLYTGEEKTFVDIRAEDRALYFKGIVTIDMKEAVAWAGPDMQVGPEAFVALRDGKVRLEVRNESGEYSLVTGDEYISKMTDNTGMFLWKPKGTASRVAGKSPKPFELKREDNRIPLIVGYPGTKTALEFYGQRVNYLQRSSLYSLITTGVSNRLLIYPSRHITCYSKWPETTFPKLCSHAYYLGGVAGYSTLYYKMVSGLLGTIPQSISQFFSDCIGALVSWAGYGDNLKDWLSSAYKWVAEYLEQVAQNRPTVGAIGELIMGILQTGADVASYLGGLAYDWLIQPCVNSIVKVLRAAVRSLQELLEKMAQGGWRWMVDQCSALLGRLQSAIDALFAESGNAARGKLDVVLEWIGRVLTMAWHCIMILLEITTAVLTFVLAKIIHVARFIFAHLGINWDEFLGPDNFTILKRIFGDDVEGWGRCWTEILEGWTNNQLQGIWEKISKATGQSGLAGVVTGGAALTYRVPMALGTNVMIWWVDRMLQDQNANIPTDHEARQKAMSEDATNIRTSLHTYETTSAQLDLFFAWADLILTIAIGVVMAFSGAIKALVRFLLSKFGEALPEWLNIKAKSMMDKLDAAQVILSVLKGAKTLFMDIVGTLGLGVVVFFKYLFAMYGFVRT